LRTEFVADVHDLRGRFFKVAPHLLDGVVGPPAHAGGGILVVGARFFASRTGRLLLSARASMLEMGPPKPLFRVRAAGRYGIARDGRFLVREGSSNPSVTVILNWFQQLKGGPKQRADARQIWAQPPIQARSPP